MTTKTSIRPTFHQNYWAITYDVMLAYNIPIAVSHSLGVDLGIASLQCLHFNFKVFKMFLNTWDVRLKISLVCTHVNLNGMSVHVKNWRKKSTGTLFWID